MAAIPHMRRVACMGHPAAADKVFGVVVAVCGVGWGGRARGMVLGQMGIWVYPGVGCHVCWAAAVVAMPINAKTSVMKVRKRGMMPLSTEQMLVRVVRWAVHRSRSLLGDMIRQHWSCACREAAYVW